MSAKPLALRAVTVLAALTALDASNAGWRQDLAVAKNLVASIDAGGPFDGGLRPTPNAQLQRSDTFAPQAQRPAADNAKEVEMEPQPQRPSPAAAPAPAVEPEPAKSPPD